MLTVAVSELSRNVGTPENTRYPRRVQSNSSWSIPPAAGSGRQLGSGSREGQSVENSNSCWYKLTAHQTYICLVCAVRPLLQPIFRNGWGVETGRPRPVANLVLATHFGLQLLSNFRGTSRFPINRGWFDSSGYLVPVMPRVNGSTQFILFYLYFDVCTKRSASKVCLFFNIK